MKFGKAGIECISGSPEIGATLADAGNTIGHYAQSKVFPQN